MSKIKLAGKSISEILKRIKRAQRNKRATKNQEKAGLSVKSVKPWNYRAGARDEQIVPVKKQSQKGSSFQPHRVRGKQGEASIKGTSEGSAASWRDEMDKYFGDLRPSKFFKKASGGDINTGMKKLSPKQKAIAAKAPPPDKIDGKDFAVLKAEKAKGRGMGLQDEKAKPGKIYKANKGMSFSDKMKLQDAKVIDKKTGKTHLSKDQLDDYVKKQKNPYMKQMGKLEQKYIKERPEAAPKSFPERRKQLGGGRSKLPGRIGTALGVASMLVPAAYGVMKQYKDYKSAKNRDKAKVKNKKMVGGMAKKYSKGGDLRLDYIDRQTRLNEKATGKKNYIAESKKTRREEYGAAKDRYPTKKDKLKGIAKRVSSVAPFMPTVSIAKGVYDKLSKSSAEKFSVGGGADAGRAGSIKGINANLQDKAERRLNVPDRTDIKKQKASVTKLKQQAKRSRLEKMKERQTGRPVYERMGGGMMQRPMGYKSGTMVKARGCKLGRTRPTKIT